MKSTIHYPAPNIVPGVNLTAARFHEIFAWISALAADSALAVRRSFQFGLVNTSDGQPALKLDKTGNQLVLSRCVAITSAGCIVGFFDGLHEPLALNLESAALEPQEKYYILLEVQPHSRMPFGPESADTPLRPLHAMPQCTLQVQKISQPMSKASNALPVGMLTMELGEWKLAGYIPPCAHLGAHPVLRERYRIYLENLEELLNLFPRIVINTDGYADKAMVELREFTHQLGSYLSANRCRYYSLTESGNAFEVFEFWIGFARQASFLLQCLKDRSDFYNLLQATTRQSTGVHYTAHSWDAAIQEQANLNVDPYRLVEALYSTDHFLETVLPIFKALSFGIVPNTHQNTWEPVKQQEHKTW